MLPLYGTLLVLMLNTVVWMRKPPKSFLIRNTGTGRCDSHKPGKWLCLRDGSRPRTGLGQVCLQFTLISLRFPQSTSHSCSLGKVGKLSLAKTVSSVRSETVGGL